MRGQGVFFHGFGKFFKKFRRCGGTTAALMQMLTSQDGGAALNHAAQNAAAGNTKELATMLSNLMKSPEGMAIMNRINDSAKK